MEKVKHYFAGSEIANNEGMKKILTFCCALLGFGATMYGASADLSSYLDTSTGGDTGNSSSFTITTNADGTLTFSGSYTDEEGESSYSVSFDIAAEAGEGDASSTYTVTMSNFSISGSLSSAFGISDDGDASPVTATATGITYIKVSAGNTLDDVFSSYLPIEITGQGLGTNPKDISSYLSLFDILGNDDFSKYAQYVTVTMTCTSEASISIKVGDTEFVACGFTVADESGLSFSATGLENIFDSLTVEGDIEKIKAGDTDVTSEVVIPDNVAYSFDDDVWSEWQTGATAASDNKYWPNSWSDGTEANGLTFTVGESGELYFQTNNVSCMIGTQEVTNYPMVITPSYRFQLGGSGTFNTKNCLGVPVEGACTIYVVACSSNETDSHYLLAAYPDASSSAVLLTSEEGLETIASGSASTTNCLFEIEYNETVATANNDGYVYLYSKSSGINIFYIYVSYDGKAPVFEDAEVVKPEPEVSDGWEVIAEEFDTTAVTGDSNNTITISFNDLGDAEYICIATTIDPDNNWGNYGALLTSTTTPDGGTDMYDNKAEFKDVTNDGKNFANDETETTVYAVIAVEDIVDACGDGANEFYLVFWGNALTVTVYASSDYDGEVGTFYPEAESGTEEGGAEEGWTLTEHTKVGYESITWEELEGYDAVKFVLYYDGDHTGWGMGGIYTFADGTNAVYAWTGTYDVDEIIITVDDLKELCDVTESGFAYNTWSPCVAIEVYFGVGEFTTGVYEGTSTAIAEVKSDVEVVEEARYNLMGQKISGAERGINIIVYSDGSAKKVLVK